MNTKFIFIIHCLIIFSFINTYAQKFGGGAYAGITSSQISGDQLSGFDKPGINLGIFTNIKTGSKSFLQLELAFDQKGSRDNANPDKGDYESYILRLNYIEMPVLFKIESPKPFSFEAGPYIGYLINYSEKDQYGEIPNSPAFNTTDYGIMGGIHYRLGDHSSFAFRASNSLLPVRNHKGGGTYRLNRGQYNSAISLTFQYRFYNDQKQP